MRLVEIPFSDWPALAELYAERKKYSNSYNLIMNFFQWPRGLAQFEVKFFSLDGVWREDGTFICQYSYDLVYNLFCNTLSDNKDRLVKALNCLEIVGQYLIVGFPEKLKEAIKQHFIDLGLSLEDFQPVGTYWYNIAREKIDEFVVEPPPRIRLAQLEVDHAEKINRLWPHRFANSEGYVRHLIQYNLSVGAFDEDGNPIAWCLMSPMGALGLLHVEEEHKRKGLGGLMVRQLSKCIAAKGFEVTGPVAFENAASCTMLEKIGFEIIDKTYYVIKPERKIGLK